MDTSLIAPCGINCALCMAYQRDKNRCSGCRSDNIPFESCRRCVIKNCEARLQNGWETCAPCAKPCARLKRLDKRYRMTYNVDIFGNLSDIKSDGVEKFLERQKAVYTCPKCGTWVCMHRAKCLKCGL